MLIVPLSIVSSCSVILLSVVHDRTWDGGLAIIFSTPDACFGEIGEAGMLVVLLPRVKIFGCIDEWTAPALDVDSGGWTTLSLKVVAVLKSESTRFCPLIGRLGETTALLSSNFLPNTDAGAESVLAPRASSTKPSFPWQFLCYKVKKISNEVILLCKHCNLRLVIGVRSYLIIFIS